MKHRSRFSRAQSALEANEYQRADQEFSGILEADPEAVEVLLHRALARLRLGRLDEALDDAGKVCKSRPDNGLGFMIQGEVYLEMKDFAEAYQSFKKACELEKDNGRAFYGYARACLGLGKRHEGADYLEQAMQFERDYVFAQALSEILSRP